MVQMNLKRRRFLKLLVLVGGGALVGYQLGRFRQPGDPFPGEPSPPETLVLNRREAALVEHVARAILPHGGLWPSLREAEVVSRLDEELFFCSAETRQDFALALQGIEFLPPLYGYFSRFQNLTAEDQLAIMMRAENTRSDLVRAATNGVRMAVNLVYFGHSSTWAAMGYDGPFAEVPPQESRQRVFYRSLQGGA